MGKVLGRPRVLAPRLLLFQKVQGGERKVRVRTADAPDHHTGAILFAEIAGEREGHRTGPPGRCMWYVSPSPLRYPDPKSLTPVPFSSSLAVQNFWDPTPRPQSQRHHVPIFRGGEHRRRGRAEGVRGVLTDHDPSSRTRDLKSDYTKTSQQRTGTPPYMAHGLLTGQSPLHLYRHDIESLMGARLPRGRRNPV